MKKLILYFFLFTSVKLANAQGQIYHISGTDTYIAAIATSKFQYYAVEQIQDNWCWAASIQMVLNYQGISVSQPDIVTKIWGRAINKPANCDVITNAANGWEYNGETLQAFSSNISAKDMIDDLAHKYPLIIGLNMPGQNVGHCYVLTALYFRLDNNNNPIPDAVILRDPWPKNPSKKRLNWDDFASRINCVVHVTY